MRSLTEAEARVLSLLLANTAQDERERLRQSQIPRSTYHAARRRAYAEGWLRDRYVPAPTLFGYPTVTFALVRPFADRGSELEARWAHEAGHVLTWIGAQLALGVFFERTPRERDRTAARIADPTLVSSSLLLHPRVEAGGVPVYFDFEGIWSHVSNTSGTRAYPKGLLRMPSRVQEEDRSVWTARNRWAARELLVRPFAAESSGRAGHLVGPFGLPFAQRRLIAEGWVLHRVLAEPARIPPFEGRRMDRVVLISGTLRAGVTPEALFATLTRECRVFPFLYVTDSSRVLLGALGQSRVAGSESTGPPGDRRPVMPTLQLALEGIQLVEELAGDLRAPVDHRYDQLAPPDGTK